jgi:DNA-binding NtrC family response regulator
VTTTTDTILFVDDDAELRTIVREQLNIAGYAVEEAEDGLTAIERIKARQYQLLLLDITMPGKSGLDVLQFVKKHSPECKVIMLTGVAGISVAIDSLRMGAEDYITKPYNMTYLLNSIGKALGKE